MDITIEEFIVKVVKNVKEFDTQDDKMAVLCNILRTYAFFDYEETMEYVISLEKEKGQEMAMNGLSWHVARAYVNRFWKEGGCWNFSKIISATANAIRESLR